jgi:NAD(P)-dependent dehydrogenase (short-subunit alcohol dehydrogenase family)
MPPDPLRGRVAVVTGANHGIGAATAVALARLGADVAVSYLRLGDDTGRSRVPDQPGDRQERADAARNRAKVLEAAERLFAEGDPHTVTMADIARAAGVGRATLNRRYPDPGSVAVALLDEHERGHPAGAARTRGVPVPTRRHRRFHISDHPVPRPAGRTPAQRGLITTERYPVRR